MVEAVERYLSEHDKGRYSREEFDRFCKKEKLALSCPVIHITGSNGKGSTANFLAHIYQAAGYKVASFIKPAFLCVNECIRFNGEEIDDETLSSLFKENEKAFLKYGLSAFEATVAIAYRYFESKHPDIAIIEAGMGGDIDATNIVDLPTILSIITSVSLEHTAYLGTTVSQIAYAKAGIIKEETPVLVGKLDEAAKEPIQEYASDMDAPFFEVDEAHFENLQNGEFHFDYRPYKDLLIPTASLYQIKNAALAIEATKILNASFPVTEEAVRKGLLMGMLPGRFERRGNVIFDGAHNPEASQSLVDSLGRLSLEKPVHILFAAMRDKNIAVMLPMLNRDAASITLTTFPHFRARTEEDYFLYVEDYPFVEDPKAALDELLEKYPEDYILVTGSLAFVGFLRNIAGDLR